MPAPHAPTSDASTRDRPPLTVRLAVVFIGTMAIWMLVAWLFEIIFDAEPTIAARFFNAILTSVLVVPMIVLARRHLDRRPWAGLGLQGARGAWRPFLVGVMAFLIPSGLGLTLALLTGWVDLHLEIPAAGVLGWAALLIVLVLVYEALPEELIFRGYLQRNLMTAMAPWLAAVVQAVLFTVFGLALWVHAEGWGVLAERGILFLAMGIVIGLLRIQTGSVWTCIGFHLSYQVVAQNLLSERFSTGNEAGLMIAAFASSFVFATTITAWLHRKDVNWSRREPE